VKANETRLTFGRALPYTPHSPTLALNEQRVDFGDVNGTKFFAWIIPSLPEDHSNYWLLLFHGSDDNVSVGAIGQDDFRAMGFNIMAPEYPGYLDAHGEPSEALVEREGQAAYQYLRTVKKVPAKNIVIFGGSLGAAIAIDLASRVEAGALVEHGGFSSGVAVGQMWFPFLPIRLLSKNRFESDTKIEKVRMPVLIIHSTEDNVIPFAHAEKLYEVAPSPKRLVRIRGIHRVGGNNPILNAHFFPEIAAFLNTEAGFHLRQPLPSIAPVIAATIDSKGIEAALAQYGSLLGEDPKRYNFREAELNRLGYYLLDKKKVNEAIAVLQLNAERFPQSFSVFDSLGDAYVSAGKDTEAMQSYRRSLVLFPDKVNYSHPKLDQLQGKSRGD
jgi:fermentation-respiration switch protein FrsA (DUF1100 family)